MEGGRPLRRTLGFVLPFLFGCGLVLLGYFLPRSSFWPLLGSYSVLFGIFCYWCWGSIRLDIGQILILGVLFRILLIGMTPNWSDDLHRFIWDGRIVVEGEDPYGAKPSELVGTEKAERMGLDTALYEKLNSPDYFSVYPPVEQFVFGTSAWLSGGDTYLNTILLRIFLFLSDLAVALALMRLLSYFALPREGVALYFLNPLVILEGVGNLHFEVLMMAFLLWGVYLALKSRDLFRPGLLLGAAVSTKLIPLLFMPFFLKTHRWRALLLFAIVGATVLLSFYPWLTPKSIFHFWDSLNLYFQTFEFNGSIYELVKWAGFQWVGYNIIERAGPALSMITLLGVMAMLLFAHLKEKREFFILFVFSLSLHLFLATTVHPWYILPLIAFTPFIPFRYPLLWSFLIVLSYSAYGHSDNMSPLFLCLEYGTLFVFFFYEFRQHSDRMRRFFKSSLFNLAPAEKRNI